MASFTPRLMPRSSALTITFINSVPRGDISIGCCRAAEQRDKIAPIKLIETNRTPKKPGPRANSYIQFARVSQRQGQVLQDCRRATRLRMRRGREVVAVVLHSSCPMGARSPV